MYIFHKLFNMQIYSLKQETHVKSLEDKNENIIKFFLIIFA